MNHRQEPVRSPSEQRASDESRRPTTSSSPARQALLNGLPVIERRMQLGGVSTAVLEGGEGPPVVLLHGPGGNAAHWMRVIPALSARHRLVVPDLPGHGGSHVESGELDVETVLRWLGELIDKTCGSRPALIGHLLGGAMAARFAIAHGRRLYRLVLIDALGLREFRPASEFAGAYGAFVAAPTEQTHQNLWQYCAHDLLSLRRQMGALWESFEAYNLEKARSASQQAAMSQLMQAFALNAISPTDLARIKVPTTLIWGRHDLATPLDVALSASARYGWPLHIIEKANDDPPVEQPDAVVKTLLSVLDEEKAPADHQSVAGGEKEAWR